MAKENKSRYAILGMLALEPMSGYTIKKLMEESTSNFWNESYGQIYPILRQITQEGLATCRSEKEEGKPERKIYTLSEKGTAELIAWLGEPVEEAPERIELLLKLFFGQLLPIATNIAHVQRFQEVQLSLLQKYQSIEALLKHSLQEQEPLEIHPGYSLITVRYGILSSQALLTWCAETLETLHTMQKDEERKGR